MATRPRKTAEKKKTTAITPAGTKASATKKKPAKKKKALDLSVEGLLQKARESEAAREKREAKLTGKKTARLRPAATVIRPANPVHFGYSFSLDENLDPAVNERLTTFLSACTSLERRRGCYCVVGPQTTPEQRRIDWEWGVVVEAETVLAQIAPDDAAARTTQLERALLDFHRWNEIVMLLSTWPADTLPAAIAVAERGLSRWPDILRTSVEQWKTRPELRTLSRTITLGNDGVIDEGDLQHATVLQTQQIEELEQQQGRFSRLTHLALSGHAKLDELVCRLTACTNLERLELSHPTYNLGGPADIDLATLLAAPHLQNLRALSLYGYTLPTTSLEALASCNQPLERLTLTAGRMPASAGAFLHRLASRRPLVSLNLKHNDLGPTGAKDVFAPGADWTRLRVLDFSANEIGDRGVTAIAAANLPELRWLNLSSNDQKEELTEKSASALASSTTLPRLEQLNLFGHPIKAEGVAAVLYAPGLPALTELNTSYCAVELHALLTAVKEQRGAPLARLARLGLQNAERGEDLPDWSVATFMKTVKVLNIERIDAESLAALLACPHLDSLEILVIGCAYGQEKEALAAVASAAPPPPRLRFLGMSGHKLDKNTAAPIANSPIGQQLWGLDLMPSYTQPGGWRACYDAGLPLVNYAHFDSGVADEHSQLTQWRDDI